MELNTENRKKAFKYVMTYLGKQPTEPAILTRNLSHKKQGVYKRTSDAKKFLKELVKSEYPVSRNPDGKLVREDIEVAN